MIIITIIIFNITHFYSIVNCEFYYSCTATVTQKERGKKERYTKEEIVYRELQDNSDSFDLVEWVLFDTYTESVYKAEVAQEHWKKSILPRISTI